MPNNLVNVALRKRTYESSSWSDTIHFQTAFAVDGNRKNRINDKSCTHTKREANPWWMVDLGGSHRISYLKVTNRGDCCGKLGYFLTIRNVLKTNTCIYTDIHTYTHAYIIHTNIHTYKLTTNTLL